MAVLPDLSVNSGLVGRIIGRSFVLEMLGGGRLGAVYRVQHRDIRQRVVLVAFFLPATWGRDLKYRFMLQSLQEVARQLPGSPVLAPLEEPGVFDQGTYWITYDWPGLTPVLLRFLEHKIVLGAWNSLPEKQEASLANSVRPHFSQAQRPLSQISRRLDNWQWKVSWVVEVLTLGGASLVGITVSEALAPFLHLGALVVVIRIMVGGLLSLFGLSLAKRFRSISADGE